MHCSSADDKLEGKKSIKENNKANKNLLIVFILNLPYTHIFIIKIINNIAGEI